MHLRPSLDNGEAKKAFEFLCKVILMPNIICHFRVLLTMPAYSAKDNALATKLVTLYSDNAKLGIPSHQGIVISFDPKTGTPVAVSIT